MGSAHLAATKSSLGRRGVFLTGLALLSLVVYLWMSASSETQFYTTVMHYVQQPARKKLIDSLRPTQNFTTATKPWLTQNLTTVARLWPTQNFITATLSSQTGVDTSTVMPPYSQDVQLRFEQRLQRLHQKCRQAEPLTFAHMRSQRLSLAGGRLRMCLIPKVGTTFARHLEKDVFRSLKLKQPGVKPKNYFFVREPYSRMVSAYIGKLATNHLWFPSFGRLIIKTFRIQATPKETKCGSDVSFSEFVKYFIRAQEQKWNKNAHFVPLHELCDVCHEHYDFSGHLETYKEDMANILHSVNVSASFDFSDSELTLTSKARSAIHFRKKIMKCEQMCQFLERIWWSFKARGLIAKDIPLPVASDQCETISATEFSSRALELHRQSKSHMDKTKQKREALVELFLQVPLEDRVRVKELLSWDFELFGYDSQPPDIFPELH